MNRNINIIIGRPVFDRTINPKQRLNGIDVFINIDENENLQYFFVSDHLGSSSFITDAGGERVWKLTGKVEQLSLNGGMVIDMATLTNKTLYTSPYMVINDQEYTKYFYAGSQRIASKIGAGFDGALVDIDVNVATINADVETIALDLVALLERSNTCAQIEWGNVTLPEPILYRVEELRYTSINNFESDMYFYNTDLPIAIGMGSSSWITDASGAVNQHLQYLPFGEDYICQRNSSWNIPYTFSGKEKDAETGYSYFGARYYDSDISIWLSVDPLSSIYPTLSPYAYVANNPIIYYDPDGRIIGIVVTSMANKPGASKQGHMAIIVGNDDIGYHLFSLEDPTGHAKDYMKEYEKIVKNGNVIWPESYSSPNYVYYSHSEKSLDELLNYMSLNAPGTANAGKDRGNGYDRITSLNNVNADQEAEFLKFMQSQTGDDFIYEFATNNCASFSINSINHFFGNIINDKTAMDRPNHEFNKITKDTHNWSVIQDGKNNPMQVIDIKAENKLLLGSEGYEN